MLGIGIKVNNSVYLQKLATTLYNPIQNYQTIIGKQDNAKEAPGKSSWLHRKTVSEPQCFCDWKPFPNFLHSFAHDQSRYFS